MYLLIILFYDFNLFWYQFQEYVANTCQVLINHVTFLQFVTALSPRNNNFDTRKILKTKTSKMHHFRKHVIF